ncbi:MAG: LysR family transcriptional regulator [Lactobacillus sp.]|nr:MAG: LysR family transcriptional regulator [Lactobacillus sp.]
MNLAQLHYFLELSKYENYTYTAEKLNITQPSLSNAIKTLELELQVPLFKKQGRSVTLTEYGRIFSHEVEHALITIDNGVAKIRSLYNDKAVIRIASLRVLSTQWVPHLVQDFLNDDTQAKLSNFRFSNSSGYSPDMLEQLQMGNYDVCFCAKINDPENIDFFPVISQPLVTIVPNNHILAKKRELTLEQTIKYDHIMFAPSSGAYSLVKNLFKQIDKHPKVVAYAEGIQAVSGLVSNNLGIAIVPYVGTLESLPIKIIPLTAPASNRILYMATLKKAYQSQLVSEFTHFVKRQTKKHALLSI